MMLQISLNQIIASSPLLLPHSTLSKECRKKYNILRTIYDYKHAEDNNWNNLKDEVDDVIQTISLLDILQHEEPNVETLNLIWDQINTTAIDNHIASIKVPK